MATGATLFLNTSGADLDFRGSNNIRNRGGSMRVTILP